jgi:hypothetical protein
MRRPTTRPVPLAPLLRTYRDAGPPPAEELSDLPGLGPRFRAVRGAADDLLAEPFLDGADADTWAEHLGRFYGAVVRPPLYAATLRRRSGLVRHAVSHLLRNRNPFPQRLDRCLAADGPYHVAGLGPSFWSALAQGLDRERNPGWTPDTLTGLRRLGLADWGAGERPGRVYAALLAIYDRLRREGPGLTAGHIDHFLTLVARMDGRELAGPTSLAPALSEQLPGLVRQERSRLPLRRRLREQGKALSDARDQLAGGLAEDDAGRVTAALATLEPAAVQRLALTGPDDVRRLLEWVGRLWHAEEPFDALAEFWQADPLPAAGLWLPAAVLHLKAPGRCPPWGDALRAGFARLDDAADPGPSPAERYRLFAEGVGWLCQTYRLHPLEAPAVLAALAGGAGLAPAREAMAAGRSFHGFCADTFRFLGELAEHNRRRWMEAQRPRYRFAVREPLRELCQALAQRYVEPVLRQQYGWELETDARSGRALSSVVKNDFGRSAPYQSVLWITYYRRACGGKRDDAQFFVRLDAAGLSYGLHVGRTARQAGRQFRKQVQEHAELLHQALAAGGAYAACRFGHADDLSDATAPASAGDLRAWATGKSLTAARRLAPDDPLLVSDELVGDILLTFDRLLPAYACAVEADPLPLLRRRAGPAEKPSGFGDDDFRAATHLSATWLERARGLLDLKKQLILQGVPGTGKTHVARALARLLTGDRPGAVRLVQFHPAYSYEEFVEGIRARTVEVEGKSEVSYPVEDGLLAAFAAEAARHPAEPFVLVIDEINRGNLPRIFGELLYLLEYRDQAVSLPYSKRNFRLPANLALIGTMNAADRSVALIDQALRRRFSFLEMPPDAAVLAAWLESHPPAAGEAFGQKVVGLFEALNEKLRVDLGPHCQVGHSYFMVPELDPDRLEVVWAHHVRPLLEEYCNGQPAKLAAYDLDRLLHGKRPAKAKAAERAKADDLDFDRLGF